MAVVSVRNGYYFHHSDPRQIALFLFIQCLGERREALAFSPCDSMLVCWAPRDGQIGKWILPGHNGGVAALCTVVKG